MTIDHISRFPNGLDYFSGRDLLWFSAAEGFVTLSGILVGYIYAPKILKNTQLVFKKLLKRAATLYACVIGLATFFIAYSYYAFDATNFSHFSHVGDLAWQLLTLQYSFGWAEFLTHYVLFLIAAPFLLYAMKKGYTWLVLLISGSIWLYGLGLSEGQVRYEFTMSWQFLFVLGMVIGTHLLQIKDWFNKSFSKQRLHQMRIGLWSSGILIYIAAVTVAYGAADLGKNISLFTPLTTNIMDFWRPINEGWFSWWTDKATAAPLRILFGSIVFWALFVFFHRYSDKINSFTKGTLMTIGKKPLVAYSLGALVIFAIEKYIPKPDEENRHFVANLIITVTALIIIYLLTKNSGAFRRLFKKD